MTRAHFVKSARKKNPVAKRGEPYYWWKFRYGGKHYSKTQPKPSQLTQSAYFAEIFGIQEQIEDLKADSDLPSAVEEIGERLRELGAEQSEKRDNMPESLQEGSTGELLQQRSEDCENAASELEAIDLSEFEADDEDDEDAEKEYWEEKLAEVQAVEIEAN